MAKDGHFVFLVSPHLFRLQWQVGCIDIHLRDYTNLPWGFMFYVGSLGYIRGWEFLPSDKEDSPKFSLFVFSIPKKKHLPQLVRLARVASPRFRILNHGLAWPKGSGKGVVILLRITWTYRTPAPSTAKKILENGWMTHGDFQTIFSLVEDFEKNPSIIETTIWVFP